MDGLTDFLVSSGRVVDLIIAFMAIEALALVLYHSRTGRGIAPRGLVGNFLAGLSLLLALRAALTEAPFIWVAGFLGASLMAHIWDLASRWRS